MTPRIVVWITGLPASGKTTFARKLARELEQDGVSACLLDGDEVRQALAPALGYSTDERAAFYESLARLAALLANQGFCVLVPATAHLRAFRERARALAPGFVEVWADTPPEECARRDPKRLYELAAAGRTSSLPGAGVQYEIPLAPDVILHDRGEDAAITTILRLVLHEGEVARLAP